MKEGESFPGGLRRGGRCGLCFSFGPPASFKDLSLNLCGEGSDRWKLEGCVLEETEALPSLLSGREGCALRL